MKELKYILLSFLIVLNACYNEIDEVIIPDRGENSLLSEAEPIPENTRKLIEGVYTVLEGNKEFGSEVVLKWHGDYLSVFTGKNAAYLVFKSGELDSVLIFEGYWRYAQGSESGFISIHVKKAEGGIELMKGTRPEQLTIRGLFAKGTVRPVTPFVIRFAREINPAKTDFWIIGHRGGGRNTDRLNASENSLEMIKLSERFGCNGIEIDVQVTRDNVPILFHDSKLSRRLIRENYMIGKISEHDWKDLRSFCTLKYGEKIPTLREALETVLLEMNLKLVWLDIKSFDIIKDIAPIQQEYMQRAKALGRDLEIILGLPDEVIYGNYMKLDHYQDYPSLCEFSYEKTLSGKCDIWAPRWSVLVTEDQVSYLHSNNIRVFTWTLDEQKFIRKFMDKNLFDGILSNYPTMIAYEYYTKTNN